MSERRDHVPFDPRHFEKEANGDASMERVFRHIYETNHWEGKGSVSGEGSGASQTATLERVLPALLQSLDAKTLLDLPCGDFGWMSRVDLPLASYIGGDLLEDIIESNQRRFASDVRQFITLDITSSTLPAADVLLCRDCLVHFSFSDIWRALRNVRMSDIAYLLATTFPDCAANEDITTGDWRPLNLLSVPFHFPSPLHLVNEDCTEGGGAFRDKSLGVWRVADLPMPPSGSG